jgi:Zn(2)-Cys(6) binuclear cluster domain-containing protein
MDGPSSTPAESLSVSVELPEGKRRKVRKGTQSCWECKRRKVRCSFSVSPAEPICDGCRRRGTACISQEFPDEPSPAPGGASTRELNDRLSQVEAIVKKLIRMVDGTNQSSSDMPVPASRSMSPREGDVAAFASGPSSGAMARGGVPTPGDSDLENATAASYSVGVPLFSP